MQQQEDIMLETKKSLDVNVGNVIAGSKEEIKKEKQKIWKANNRNHIKKQKELYYKLNREKRIKQVKNWRKNNPIKAKILFKNLYRKNKIAHIMRVRITLALKGISKHKKTMELVGCSIEELWIHLEKQFQSNMTRENHGLWHIDHIKPCAKFDLSKPEEQQKCFHFSNLQPMWAIDNIKKGAKYEMFP